MVEQRAVIARVDAVMTEIITPEMQQIKVMIAQTVAKREILKLEMHEWYEKYPNQKYENLNKLIITDSVLSELDSHYKRLWDSNNAKSSA
jgi:hypothetical protein